MPDVKFMGPRRKSPSENPVPPPVPDDVNHPKHYTTGRFEVIDVIADWKLGFNEGNVVKYVARAKHKGNEIQDLKKARFYLDYAIKRLEGGQ